MIRKAIVGSLALVLAVGTVSAGGDRWLHIAVDEHSGDRETVRVNLPLQLVEAVLPLIEADDFQRGRIKIDWHEINEIDLPEILLALRDAEDGEYITVDSDHEQVRVAKERDYLTIHVDGRHEEVDLQIRLSVVGALFSDRPNELDLLAAVQALDEDEEADLVTVTGDDETVRIWIDRNSTAD